jgi:hypothetical protein
MGMAASHLWRGVSPCRGRFVHLAALHADLLVRAHPQSHLHMRRREKGRRHSNVASCTRLERLQLNWGPFDGRNRGASKALQAPQLRGRRSAARTTTAPQHQAGHLTSCTSTSFSKPLKAMEAFRESRFVGDSSTAMARWPRAAAVSENSPVPAPTSSST